MGEVQGGDGYRDPLNLGNASGATETALSSTSTPTQPVRAASTRALILGWCQQAPAGGQTSWTPRVRRGGGTTGALVGGANAEGTEGGGTNSMPVFIMVVDPLVVQDATQYTVTGQQAGAAGGAPINQNSQAVFLVG